jgi:hypothetical protein
MKMGIARHNAVSVIDFNSTAITVHIAREGHRPGAGTVNLRSVGCHHIQSWMESIKVIDRVNTRTKPAAELVIFEGYPERQIRGQALQLENFLRIKLHYSTRAKGNVGAPFTARHGTYLVQKAFDESDRAKQSRQGATVRVGWRLSFSAYQVQERVLRLE